MEYPKELYQALFNLSTQVVNEVDDVRKEGKMRIVPYERIPVYSIDHRMESFLYDWQNITTFEYYEWDSAVFAATLDKLKAIPEFDVAAERLSEIFPLTLDVIKKFGLMNFVRVLMIQLTNKEEKVEHSKQLVDIFLNDYHTLQHKHPRKWNVDIWLNNVTYNNENIAILSEGLRIRRPEKEDFVLTRPQGPFDEFERITGRGFPGKCIISFTVDVPSGQAPNGIFPKAVNESVEKWVDVLRLFMVGNVTIKQISAFPESIWDSGSHYTPKSPFDSSWEGKIEHTETSNFNYFIKDTDLIPLNSFATKLLPLLGTISHQAYLTGSHYDLAFHRYKDALLRSRVNVNRIVSSISALEALLSETSGDITYKISSRTSLLMSFFDFQPIDVFEKLKVAYDIRSKLVHGGDMGTSGVEFSRHCIHEIIEYARVCLLISIQLKNHFKNKSAFIKNIDHALVDNHARELLQQQIDKETIIPLSRFRYCIEYTQYSKKDKWLNQ